MSGAGDKKRPLQLSLGCLLLSITCLAAGIALILEQDYLDVGFLLGIAFLAASPGLVIGYLLRGWRGAVFMSFALIVASPLIRIAVWSVLRE